MVSDVVVKHFWNQELFSIKHDWKRVHAGKSIVHTVSSN